MCNSENYNTFINDNEAFKNELQLQYESFPELYPLDFKDGFILHGFTKPSIKMDGFTMHRVLLNATGEVYSIRPSFVIPYMRGYLTDVEKALYLHNKHSVPCSGLSYTFGKNDMFWDRLIKSIGRNSIVGTTVKSPEILPEDLVGDEKHTKNDGEKTFIATTVGNGCVLGAAVCSEASESELTESYSKFAKEAANVDPSYEPRTINVDGWDNTKKAWKNNYSGVTILLCFLHAFLSIRKRCRKEVDFLKEVSSKIWKAFKAKSKKSFSQQLRRLSEWAALQESSTAIDKVIALCNNKDDFICAFDNPGCHRTSNMVDRLMRMMDRFLFNRQYFHGYKESAELSIRSWAILKNFIPFCPRAQNKENNLDCPASRLNGFYYSDNWLENLMICTSMAGYRA
jgi:hypothetical protein